MKFIVPQGIYFRNNVSHKDRFVRFGYEWFERFLQNCGVEILIVNNESLSLSERVFQCENCQMEMDRDFNASLNLKYATEYAMITTR